MEWLCEATAQIRARVGLSLGAEPTTEALLGIVDLFPDRLTLRFKHIDAPVCFRCPQGAVIYMPAYLKGRELNFCLGHEIGHGLWDNPLADYLIQQRDPALARLGRYVAWSNERQANVWTAALFGRHLCRH
jgi:hypothetical protein